MLHRTVTAIQFAEAFATRCQHADWRNILTAPASEQEEHKVLAPAMRAYLDTFLHDNHAGHAGGGNVLFDWEGNSTRTWAQSHSYDLLGTSTHPDAAILQPFTCAFEFDRESSGGVSQFKAKVLKAAAHVLSKAYDASVLVYVLRRSTKDAHIEDKSPYTAELLRTLRGHGLFVAFVGAETTAVAPGGLNE